MNRLKSKEIQLTKRDLKKAEDFAKARESHDVSKYHSRGAFKTVDLVTGALGELAVYKLLKDTIKVSKPDFSLYEVRNKSFAADLQGENGELFHCKGQTMESVNRYGASWLMQKRDKVINNPSELDYMIPCVVDLDTLKVNIYGIIKYQDILDNDLLGECKVEWLRRTKKAIYLDDLKKLNCKKRWNIEVDIS